MDELVKKHLQDIVTAIEEIESFFGKFVCRYSVEYGYQPYSKIKERSISPIG